VSAAQAIEFREARIDQGDGQLMAQAMRGEINSIYPGHDLEGDDMPRAGHAELSPPDGAFVVGYHDGRPVCCGGVKRLGPDTCEIKRMYLVPDLRGQGVARRLLVALEDKARELGYTIARLDTGPAQPSARALYESAGYASIDNFNANPVATFWGEKPLV
jgi:GNAT superfamily N-acetyltransferase